MFKARYQNKCSLLAISCLSLALALISGCKPKSVDTGAKRSKTLQEETCQAAGLALAAPAPYASSPLRLLASDFSLEPQKKDSASRLVVNTRAMEKAYSQEGKAGLPPGLMVVWRSCELRSNLRTSKTCSGPWQPEFEFSFALPPFKANAPGTYRRAELSLCVANQKLIDSKFHPQLSVRACDIFGSCLCANSVGLNFLVKEPILSPSRFRAELSGRRQLLWQAQQCVAKSLAHLRAKHPAVTKRAAAANTIASNIAHLPAADLAAKVLVLGEEAEKLREHASSLALAGSLPHLVPQCSLRDLAQGLALAGSDPGFSPRSSSPSVTEGPIGSESYIAPGRSDTSDAKEAQTKDSSESSSAPPHGAATLRGWGIAIFSGALLYLATSHFRAKSTARIKDLIMPYGKNKSLIEGLNDYKKARKSFAAAANTPMTREKLLESFKPVREAADRLIYFDQVEQESKIQKLADQAAGHGQDVSKPALQKSAFERHIEAFEAELKTPPAQEVKQDEDVEDENAEAEVKIEEAKVNRFSSEEIKLKDLRSIGVEASRTKKVAAGVLGIFGAVAFTAGVIEGGEHLAASDASALFLAEQAQCETELDAIAASIRARRALSP